MTLRSKSTWFGVAIEARDAQALVRFYERLLGWTVYTDSPEWCTLAPSKDAGYNLAVQRDESFERPTWPSEPGKQQMQMHLDLEVDDLEEAVAHATTCGAELAAYQPQQDVRVMLDPEGHPFCLYVSDDD